MGRVRDEGGGGVTTSDLLFYLGSVVRSTVLTIVLPLFCHRAETAPILQQN